jgi:ribulose-phosphate 3-epimerase
MSELIPAILVQDEASFRERVSLVEGLVTTVHLDVMDGAFVPNRTWFDAKILAALHTPVRFELHLMVNDPKRVIEECRMIEHVTRYLWHLEVPLNHADLIRTAHEAHKEAGLAVNPKTPVDTLTPCASLLDEILVMGAEPGFSGQTLQPHTIEKARDIHGRWPNVPLGFDINVNAETIPTLRAAGVSRFCSGGAIYHAADPRKALKDMQALL